MLKIGIRDQPGWPGLSKIFQKVTMKRQDRELDEHKYRIPPPSESWSQGQGSFPRSLRASTPSCSLRLKAAILTNWLSGPQIRLPTASALLCMLYRCALPLLQRRQRQGHRQPRERRRQNDPSPPRVHSVRQAIYNARRVEQTTRLVVVKRDEAACPSCVKTCCGASSPPAATPGSPEQAKANASPTSSRRNSIKSSIAKWKAASSASGSAKLRDLDEVAYIRFASEVLQIPQRRRHHAAASRR